MTTLLVNGCSFAQTWQNANKLGDRLGIENTVNIGLAGGSNARTFRTTMEYLINNTDVSFVVLMLTFWDRQEAPWGDKNVPYDKNWVSYASNGIVNRVLEQINKSEVETKLLERYIIDRFKHDFDNSYMDKWLMDIITFGAWLESIGVNYCMFNTCEHRYQNFKDPKFQLIEKNPKIINIKTFLSNQYIYDNGGKVPENELENFKRNRIEFNPSFVHWDESGGDILTDFLYNYINKNCIRK
jgi:hypothetical protein